MSGLSRRLLKKDVFDLPSWVPDLTNTSGRHETFDWHRRGYSAGGEAHAEHRVVADLDHLWLRGWYFDEITVTTTSPDIELVRLIEHLYTDLSADIDLAPIVMHHSKRLQELLTIVDEKVAPLGDVHNGLNIKEALWRTLTNDLDGQDHKSNYNIQCYLSDCNNFIAFARQYVEIAPKSYVPEPGDPSMLTTFSKVSSGKYDEAMIAPASLMSQVNEFLSFKVFAITMNGYMVLAPPDTKSGDIITIAQGSPVPHVLRRTEDKDDESYYFCGEAYVHGIMHGEAMTADVEKKWFVLR